MSHLIFVTGGARSGKSRYAEELAERAAQAVTYLATAQALDQEMQERIARHRADRPDHWLTVEEPLHLPEAVKQIDTPVLLLDCLSLWVSNLLLDDWSEERLAQATTDLLEAVLARPGLSIFVSNEVGFGIVPDNALARRYRDLLGRTNQTCAGRSHEAWLLVSGLPLKLRG